MTHYVPTDEIYVLFILLNMLVCAVLHISFLLLHLLPAANNQAIHDKCEIFCLQTDHVRGKA